MFWVCDHSLVYLAILKDLDRVWKSERRALCVHRGINTSIERGLHLLRDEPIDCLGTCHIDDAVVRALPHLLARSLVFYVAMRLGDMNIYSKMRDHYIDELLYLYSDLGFFYFPLCCFNVEVHTIDGVQKELVVRYCRELGHLLF